MDGVQTLINEFYLSGQLIVPNGTPSCQMTMCSGPTQGCLMRSHGCCHHVSQGIGRRISPIRVRNLEDLILQILICLYQKPDGPTRASMGQWVTNV